MTITVSSGTAQGTPGRDVILGSSSADVIQAGGGDDVVCALGGADTIEGGEGADLIDGGNDADVIDAGPGDDRILGGPGNDVLHGRDGKDRLDGQAGRDQVTGGEGDDAVQGSDGADALGGDAGNDLLDAGDANDVLSGGDGNDRLLGGAGSDDLVGGLGDDVLEGGSQTDQCDGGAGVNVFKACEKKSGAGAAGGGTVELSISAPDGVPANVILEGPTRRVVTKAPTGPSTTASAELPAGTYTVALPAVVHDGARFVGASAPTLVIRAGQKAALKVAYAAEPGATDLHATSLSGTRATLRWSGPPAAEHLLRRVDGDAPASTRTQGRAVALSGSTAEDDGLSPGSTYTYSLFTRVGGQWYGPLSVTVGTAPAGGSTNAAFVAPSTTLLATAADIKAVLPEAPGVAVGLTPSVPTPLLGSAVILPVSDVLPGGLLGAVTAVSPDGRTATLEPAGLADAFDYYALEGGTPTIAALATDEPRVDREGSGDAGDLARLSVTAAAASTCSAGTGKDLTLDPQVELEPRFSALLNKYSVAGVEVPVSATFDMRVIARVRAAATVEVKGTLTCDVPLPSVVRSITAYPVPMAAVFSPVAKVSVTGSMEVSNLGVEAEAGVELGGTLDASGQSSITGNAVAAAKPLVPDGELGAELGLKVGGALVVGPGAGLGPVGAILGLKGTFLPVDATFRPGLPQGHPDYLRCVRVDVASSRALSLSAGFFLGQFSKSADLPLAFLSSKDPYVGSPFQVPAGCDEPSAPAPESLLGSGVTKVSDSTTGSAGQAGFVTGFVPGKKTWVLSTGLVADATGEPANFASTDVGTPGDDELTALSGYPTYDAASYSVTVKPTGDLLHVRYVFASEEYPEYVGRQFNDVVQVFVDGVGCARAPDGRPVSVNSINKFENQKAFVDNLTGAAGYATSMNGLTIPLECAVPVTPGKPVTVELAVADASDRVYDSAVALVDGGIFAD